MGLFRKERNEGEPVVRATDAIPPVDLLRLDQLVQSSLRLRELGVAYELIEQRAAQDGVSFNEALETVYREHFRG